MGAGRAYSETRPCRTSFFFFNDTATTEIYTLSLHDALPISTTWWCWPPAMRASTTRPCRSEEHTSELQSHLNLVCRLLLEKKKKRGTATEPSPGCVGPHGAPAVRLHRRRQRQRRQPPNASNP